MIATPAQLADKTTDLLPQDVNRAGLYSDGSFAPSITITKAITINKLEKARSIDLGQKITTTLTKTTLNYEHWSWEGLSPMSAVLLPTLATPDQFGYIEDPLVSVFKISFAT